MIQLVYIAQYKIITVIIIMIIVIINVIIIIIMSNRESWASYLGESLWFESLNIAGIPKSVGHLQINGLSAYTD